MLYIASKAHTDAAPFLQLLRLKKDMAARRFEMFYGPGAALVVTGAGEAEAAACVAALLSRAVPGKPDEPDEPDEKSLFAWIGCEPEDEAADEADAAPGGTVLTPSICVSARAPDGRVFYPDLLFAHPFRETEEDAPEAAGAFRAASYFFPPHRIVLLRTRTAEPRAREIVEWLRAAEHALPGEPKIFSEEESALLGRVANALRLTETPARELSRLAAWHKLRDDNLNALLGPALSGPAPGPNERKAAFAKLRERLLEP